MSDLHARVHRLEEALKYRLGINVADEPLPEPTAEAPAAAAPEAPAEAPAEAPVKVDE